MAVYNDPVTVNMERNHFPVGIIFDEYFLDISFCENQFDMQLHYIFFYLILFRVLEENVCVTSQAYKEYFLGSF